MARGPAGRRLLAPGSLGLDRRIGRTLAIYLVIITVIVGYNARAIADQRGSALSVNVAARQRALAERYEKDVILTTLGIQADPGDDADQLLANADALLHGGEVQAVQGADEQIQIRPASRDPIVVAKINEEYRLIQELIAVGDELYAMRAGQPGYPGQLRNLRVVGAQVTSISNEWNEVEVRNGFSKRRLVLRGGGLNPRRRVKAHRRIDGPGACIPGTEQRLSAPHSSVRWSTTHRT